MKKYAVLPPSVTVTDGADILPQAEAERLLEQALGTAKVEHYSKLARMEQLITGELLYSGNRFKILIDGPDVYDAMAEAIGSARDHIHLETFILADDNVAQELSQLLTAKAADGVDVRVLFDSYGSIGTSKKFFEELLDKGIEVMPFRSVNPLRNLRLWRLQNRDHRKLLIIDGETGFIGGLNISGVYTRSSFSSPGSKQPLHDHWRDSHACIKGPVVSRMQKLFLDVWKQESGMSQRLMAFKPTPVADGEKLVRIIYSTGGDDKHQIYDVYMAAFAYAEERIWITQGYFAPNDAFVHALIAAAERGVDVRLLVPGFTDSWMTINASRRHYSRLLRGGVKLFERSDALLHAKTAVIDGVWSTVGSANLDYRSFLHNNEANAVVYSREIGDEMERMFEIDQSHTTPISLAEWKKRSLWRHFAERIASLFDYWL